MILEHDDEPLPGLPERLPEGERILWQGAPDWRAVARRVFWTRPVAIYFTLFAAWSAIDALEQGAGTADALVSASAVALPAAAALGLLYLLAYITARTTIYTITNRRVALRIGVAMQIIVNLPFNKLAGAQTGPAVAWHGRHCVEADARRPLRLSDAVAPCPALGLQPHATIAALRAGSGAESGGAAG